MLCFKVFQFKQVAMRTLSGSELAIGFYPKFIYNSSGGGGIATASASSKPGRTNLEFDPYTVSIPDVTSQSSKSNLYIACTDYLRSESPSKCQWEVQHPKTHR